MNNGLPQKSKKVLIVAYHFPPDAAVGAMRPQKFVKYLPEFGWQPYVLTLNEKYMSQKDFLRLKDVKDVPVFKTIFFRTPSQWLAAFKNSFFKRKTSASFAGDNQSVGQLKQWKISSNPFKKFILEADLFPDDKKGWILPAVVTGYFLIKKLKIGVIYATSPPYSCDIVGLILAKMTGCRLVIDHRDPWAYCKPLQEIGCLRALHYFAEKLVLQNASAIITTTERYAVDIVKNFPGLRDNVHVIPNGYDPDDFDFNSKIRKEGKFIFTYVGTFYLDRSPAGFLNALKQLIDEESEIINKIQVNLIGSSGGFDGKTLEGLIAESQLQDVVNIIKTVSYEKSLQYVLHSNVLLLFAPNQPLQIPAKTFEYIAAKTPILAFTEEGATADIVSKYRAGIVVTQDDVGAIKNALKTFLQNKTNENLFYCGVDVSELERKNLTGKLVKIIEDLT